MAALSTQGGMGSLEDPSQEAASQQSTEDWEKVTWAEEEEEEVVTSLDGLADFIKTSLKPFAIETKYVLENCQESQECEIKSFAKACAQLQEVCQICDQKDRLIIAGSGNVGKSTIANALLGGEKFWPTASYRMTSRICEAQYNASSTPEPIPKEMVQKSGNSRHEESSHPLNVFHPSLLLKPDVILVDLPGLDQKREHLKSLEEYMNCHSDSSVALLYVIDVKNDICEPDRLFFEKLMSSPWKNLSQSLGLLVNKCDIEGDKNGASSDEEAPDYGNLLADITQETQNYCTPTVMDLSMTDKKKNHPTAVLKWQKVEAFASNALAQLKCNRIIKILLSLAKVMDVLELAVNDDEHLRAELLKERQHRLSDAAARVQELRDNERYWVSTRAKEIRQTLEERQEEHLDAILSAGVPHYNQIVQEEAGLDEVDEVMHNLLQVMVANDIHISARSSSVYGALFQHLYLHLFGLVRTTYIVFGTILSSLIHGPIVGMYFAHHFAALSKGALSNKNVLVDERYVRQRFAEMYREVLEKYPSRWASQEHASIVTQAERDLEEQRESGEALMLHFLDDRCKAKCSELLKKFDSFLKLREAMIEFWMK